MGELFPDQDNPHDEAELTAALTKSASEADAEHRVRALAQTRAEIQGFAAAPVAAAPPQPVAYKVS